MTWQEIKTEAYRSSKGLLIMNLVLFGLLIAWDTVWILYFSFSLQARSKEAWDLLFTIICIVIPTLLVWRSWKKWLTYCGQIPKKICKSIPEECEFKGTYDIGKQNIYLSENNMIILKTNGRIVDVWTRNDIIRGIWKDDYNIELWTHKKKKPILWKVPQKTRIALNKFLIREL